MLKDVGVVFSDDREATELTGRRPLLLCFSHLRWDFVFQRPQHLMSRFAATHNVHFWEEPVFEPDGTERLEIRNAGNVTLVIPHLPDGLDESMSLMARTIGCTVDRPLRKE